MEHFHILEPNCMGGLIHMIFLFKKGDFEVQKCSIFMGGGFKYSSFLTLFGEDSQFD